MTLWDIFEIGIRMACYTVMATVGLLCFIGAVALVNSFGCRIACW